MNFPGSPTSMTYWYIFRNSSLMMVLCLPEGVCVSCLFRRRFINLKGVVIKTIQTFFEAATLLNVLSRLMVGCILRFLSEEVSLGIGLNPEPILLFLLELQPIASILKSFSSCFRSTSFRPSPIRNTVILSSMPNSF